MAANPCWFNDEEAAVQILGCCSPEELNCSLNDYVLVHSLNFNDDNTKTLINGKVSDIPKISIET